MPRKPPDSSNALFVDSIYRIERSATKEEWSFRLYSMSRKTVRVRHYGGRFIRYNGALWRLHAEDELPKFIKGAAAVGILVHSYGVPFNPRKHGKRQFFLAWQKPIGAYYDPSARF